MTAKFDFDTATPTSTSHSELTRKSIFELQKLDALARDMERKWGVCRLPLLVDSELSDRFFSQHRKTSQALRGPDPSLAIRETARMATAWRRLDAEAERLGASTLAPVPIEALMNDGTVIAIVRDHDEAHAVNAEGRDVRVFAACEIARLVEALPTIAAVKEHWPGARVGPTRVETPDEFWQTGDDIPF